MASLTFDTLRQAHHLRLPRFRNSKGAPAHTSPDGSCWSPALWLQALVGELGEFARVRHDYETGALPYAEFQVLARKELADVQAYLDLLAWRALDELAPRSPEPEQADAAQQLMQLMAGLGDYANLRKKHLRGDFDLQALQEKSAPALAEAAALLPLLSNGQEQPTQRTTKAHPTGVDLGEAMRDKFNEVSLRTQVPVWLYENQVLSVRNGAPASEAGVIESVLMALRTSHPDPCAARLDDVAEQLKELRRVFFADAAFALFYKHQDADFVYDGASGVYLAGSASAGHHSDLLAALYRFRHNLSPFKRNVHADADQFILEGLGMMKSRAGSRIYVGPGFTLNTAQASLQRDLQVLDR